MGRDLSKAKPDVVKGGYCKPNCEECTDLASLFVRCCVVRKRVKGLRSSLSWWVCMRRGWAVRSHTTPGEALCSQGGGLELQGESWWCKVWGRDGGGIGQTAGGVIVLPDSQSEHWSPWPLLTFFTGHQLATGNDNISWLTRRAPCPFLHRLHLDYTHPSFAPMG